MENQPNVSPPEQHPEAVSGTASAEINSFAGQQAAPPEPGLPPQQGAVQPSTPPLAAAPAKKKHRALRIVVGVVVVLLLLGLWLGLTFVKANAEYKAADMVSHAFVQDIISGDATAAYQLTSPDFQKTVPQDKFQGLVQVVHQNVPATPASASSWKINKTNSTTSGSTEQALIDYAVAGPGGSGTIQTTVQKNSGQWQIVYVHFPPFALKGYTIQ